MNHEELKAKRSTLHAELDEMRSAYNASPDPAVLKRMDDTRASIGRVDKEIVTDREERRSALSDRLNDPTLIDGGTSSQTRTLGNGRDEAMRSIHARHNDGTLADASAERLVSVVERDESGHDAEYIRAVSDPAYESAFGRLVASGGSAVLSAGGLLSDDEIRAVRTVGQSMRSLNITTGSAGEFAIPIALDPTINLTSPGVVNPLRSLANVSTISTSEWNGVTSAGISAEYVAEGTEVADHSPTIGQTKVKPQRMQSYVQFTHEAGEDWPNLSAELGKLFTDARESLEAEKMASGSGTNEPFGIVTGATETVTTTAAAAIANADVYALQAALPPRWQPNATFLSNITIANGIYVKSGPGSTEPALFNEDRDKLLGKTWKELSTLTSSLAAASVPLLYGDISNAFKIVDRLGATVELIPNVIGANRRPTGERGLYMTFRSGSKVVNPAAIRALKMHA